MRTIFLTALLAVAGFCLATENVTPSSYLKPWNAVLACAPDLAWQIDGVSKPIFDALPDEAKFETEHGKLISYYSSFAPIDLTGDGKNEIIVWSHEFYSGGPEFIIMQKRGNRWVIIGEIQGGFTISKRQTNGYADIETRSRHPETHHRLWRFARGSYKLARTEIGPLKDRDDLPYVPVRKGKF